jgi:hypothetical protein
MSPKAQDEPGKAKDLPYFSRKIKAIGTMNIGVSNIWPE